jgi:hypothetical protein
MAYIGSTVGAITFLSDLGHVCPEHFNPADFYIRALAVYPGKEEESRKNIKTVCDAFASSTRYTEVEDKVMDEIARYEFLNSVSSNASGSSDSVSSIKNSALLNIITCLQHFFVFPNLKQCSDQNLLGRHV